MRALLLSILYTAVFLILGSAFNYARAADDCDKTYSEGKLLSLKSQDDQNKLSGPQLEKLVDWRECKKDAKADSAKDKEKCTEAVTALSKTADELNTACTQITAKQKGEQKKCANLAVACATRTTSPLSSNQFMLAMNTFTKQYPQNDFNSTCLNADMTKEDWEKSKTKKEEALEKKKEKFEKVQEEIQKVLENANKAKQKMDEKTHDMDEEFQKLQKQAEEAGDKEQAEAAKASRDNESRLREIQSKNLAMTQAKAAKMQERAAMLTTMTDALIQTDCLEKIQKFIKEMNGAKRGSIVTGGAGSAFNASSTSSTMAQSKWQACLSAAQGQRDATLTKYQGEIQAIDQEMSNLNQEYRAAQKTIQQNEQLNYKAAARRENDKAVAQNLYQQRRQKLFTDYQTAVQEASDKRNQLNGQISGLQAEQGKLENELSGLTARRPGGDKTYESATEISSKLPRLIDAAKSSCGCSSEGGTDNMHKQCKIIARVEGDYGKDDWNEARKKLKEEDEDDEGAE